MMVMEYHFLLYHTLKRAREERVPIAHLIRSLKTGVCELPGDEDACWRVGEAGEAVGTVHLARENAFLKKCLDFLLYQLGFLRVVDSTEPQVPVCLLDKYLVELYGKARGMATGI